MLREIGFLNYRITPHALLFGYAEHAEPKSKGLPGVASAKTGCANGKLGNLTMKKNGFKNRIREYTNFLRSLFITNYYLIKGMWKLTKLPQPAVTIFGSSRLPEDSPYAKSAMALAKKLALKRFSIITGGGPGIMVSANKGAFEAAKKLNLKYKDGSKLVYESSLGIGLTRLTTEKFRNEYIHDYIEMEHFFSRKWLLVRYANAFVAFPGGFGTMDELSEVLTLIQTERMKKMPIVLFGKSYWEKLRDFVQENMLKNNLISQEDRNLITLMTDDVDEAYNTIIEGCKCLGYDENKN